MELDLASPAHGDFGKRPGAALPAAKKDVGPRLSLGLLFLSVDRHGRGQS